jgi:hypothetical protein
MNIKIVDAALTEASNEVNAAESTLREAEVAWRANPTRRTREDRETARAWVRGARRRCDAWTRRLCAIPFVEDTRSTDE